MMRRTQAQRERIAKWLWLQDEWSTERSWQEHLELEAEDGPAPALVEVRRQADELLQALERQMEAAVTTPEQPLRQVLQEIADTTHGPGGTRNAKKILARVQEMARVALRRERVEPQDERMGGKANNRRAHDDSTFEITEDSVGKFRLSERKANGALRYLSTHRTRGGSEARRDKHLAAQRLRRAEGDLAELRDGLADRGFIVGRNPDGVDDTVASTLLIVDDLRTAHCPVPQDDKWAEDEWHTDEAGKVLGGAPPNFTFVAKSTLDAVEALNERYRAALDRLSKRLCTCENQRGGKCRGSEMANRIATEALAATPADQTTRSDPPEDLLRALGWIRNLAFIDDDSEATPKAMEDKLSRIYGCASQAINRYGERAEVPR